MQRCSYSRAPAFTWACVKGPGGRTSLACFLTQFRMAVWDAQATGLRCCLLALASNPPPKIIQTATPMATAAELRIPANQPEMRRLDKAECSMLAYRNVYR